MSKSKHSWKIWAEWAQSNQPSLWLKKLRDSGELSSYAEIHSMIGVPQDPTWHPEGCVFTHTCHVLDAAAEIADREKLTCTDRELLIFSALCHDFGKVKATYMKNGKWTSPVHGIVGVPFARSFLRHIECPGITGASNKDCGGHLYEKLSKLMEEHLSYINVSSDKTLLRLADRLKPASIKELLWLIEADVSGRPPLPKGLPEIAQKLKHRSIELSVYEQGPSPFVTGKWLLVHGLMAEGPQMGAIIKQAWAAQLEGQFLSEDEALLWVRGQVFRPLLNGTLLIESGIIKPGPKVGRLLKEAKEAQRQNIFFDLESAKNWARNWVSQHCPVDD